MEEAFGCSDRCERSRVLFQGPGYIGSSQSIVCGRLWGIFVSGNIPTTYKLNSSAFHIIPICVCPIVEQVCISTGSRDGS